MKNFNHEKISSCISEKHKKHQAIASSIKRISDDSLRIIDDSLWLTQSTEADDGKSNQKRWDEEDKYCDWTLSPVSCYRFFEFSKRASITNPLVLHIRNYRNTDHGIDPASIKILEKLTNYSNKLLSKCESKYASDMSQSCLSEREAAYSVFSCFFRGENHTLIDCFLEEQKLLEAALFHSKIIEQATKIFLAYLNSKNRNDNSIHVTEKDFELLLCNNLQEMEHLQNIDSLDLGENKKITVFDLQKIVQILEKRRSWTTYFGDFFQEILDDILELIPALHQIISTTGRSSASLAGGLFRQAQKTTVVNEIALTQRKSEQVCLNPYTPNQSIVG
jgi:hypothetical protein